MNRSARSLARLVWQMVRRFDLTPLLDRVEAREAPRSSADRPGDPILVALWLYAALDGVGSAREPARLCEQHHAYRWLCGGVGTDHHTLSDFRVSARSPDPRRLFGGASAMLARLPQVLQHW